MREGRIGGSGARWQVLLLGWLGVAASPVDAQRLDETRSVWIATATAMTGALLLDQTLQRHVGVDDGEAVHGLAQVGNLLGRGKVAAVVLAGASGTGRWVGAPELAHTAEHTLFALLAAGAVNGALKAGVGRQRPDGDDDARFRPLNLDDRWQSFPSGHAVSAFAVAGALSEELRRPWVTGVAYGAAGLVGWSRVHENRHWTSDVVAGAIVGSLTARFTVRHLHREPGDDVLTEPVRSNSRWASVRVVPTPAGVVVTVATR